MAALAASLLQRDPDNWRGYEWTALSVTAVGALLASIQGSALLIALPDIMTQLHAGFMTIMWVIPGFMLIATALVPVVGRLADMFGRKNLNSAGFAVFTLGPVIGGILTAIDCRLVFLINVPLSVTGLTPFQTAIN